MLLMVVCFCSCDSTPNDRFVKEKEVPIEVMKLKEAKVFDTLFVIQTADKMVVFDNKTHEYQYSVKKKGWSDNEIIALIIILLFIGALLGACITTD